MDLGHRAVGEGGPLTETIYQAVWQHPGCTATEIAKAVNRDVAIVSGILHRLYKRGNVNRVDGGGIRGGYTYFIRRR